MKFNTPRQIWAKSAPTHKNVNIHIQIVDRHAKAFRRAQIMVTYGQTGEIRDNCNHGYSIMRLNKLKVISLIPYKRPNFYSSLSLNSFKI